MKMTLFKSANYGLSAGNELHCARPQQRHFGELLADIVGKGFPFAEELMSRSSVLEAASRSNIGNMELLPSTLLRYPIENRGYRSIPTCTAHSSTLVRRVQLGMCNQLTFLCSGRQAISQCTRSKGLKDLRVTDVTQRAKL
jgi:hypothetical protein